MKFRNLRTQGYASTRERLGLSQRQLAEQLGVSHSVISMAETGRRSLPVAVLLKIAELEIKLATGIIRESAAKSSELETKLHSAEMVKLKEMQNDIQVQRLTMKLQEMGLKYKKLEKELQTYEELVVAFAADSTNPFYFHLKIHREKIIAQLKACNLPAQLLLQNKIAALSAESSISRAVRQKFS